MEALPGADGAWRVLLDGVEHSIERAELRDGELCFAVAGRSYRMLVHVLPDAVLVADGLAQHRFARVEEGAPEAAEDAAGALQSQMPGKVLALLVEPGTPVRKGQALLILEAMKMEHELCAPADGVVRGYPRAARRARDARRPAGGFRGWLVHWILRLGRLIQYALAILSHGQAQPGHRGL